MSGGMRGSLRLLASAFAATAALVFLQTFVLRAVPYDASWFAVVAGFFRAAFMATDVATIVALIALGRRVPAIRTFTRLGSVVVGLSVVSAAVGWLVSSLADAAGGGAIGGIEPMFTFGATFLIVFALAAVLGATAAPDRRRNIGFAVALGLAVLVLLVRVGSAFSPGPTSIIVAWIRWAVAVAQPASLAAVALLISRAKEAAGPSTDAAAAAAAGGGYRAAGEGAVADAPPELAAPGPATIDPLRRASSGIALYRAAFIVRACAVFAMAFLVLAGGAALAAVVLPVLGGVTAVIIAVGVGRQRALATFSGTAMRAAHIAFIATAVAEICSLFWIVGELTSRPNQDIGALSFPAATLFGGLGVLFVSRAHERAGDLLYSHRLAGLARSTQGLLVLAVTAFLAMFAASAQADRRHSSDLGLALAIALAFGFALLLLCTLIAVVVLHIMTLNQANRVLKDRLAKATP